MTLVNANAPINPSRSGSGYGRGFNSSPLTTLKRAVFAPIPIASERMAATIGPGVRDSVRIAKRM
jgi:hypothetical protein